MLIFGHLGITTAIVGAGDRLIFRNKNSKDNFIDYRFVMAGALLPDIIDKPLVQILYGLDKHEGHLFAHSFIFSGLLILLGIILNAKNKNILMLGLCCLIHQVFDLSELLPKMLVSSSLNSTSIIQVVLIYLYNLAEPVYKIVPYFKGVMLYLMEPYVYITEISGFLILACSFYKLIINRRINDFIKHGRLF